MTATALRATLAATCAARTDRQLIDALIVADHMRMASTEAGRMTIAYMVDALTERHPAVLDALEVWERDVHATEPMASAVAKAAKAVVL